MATKQEVENRLGELNVPYLLKAFKTATSKNGGHRHWIDLAEIETIIRLASSKGPAGRGPGGIGPREWKAILAIADYNKLGPKAKTRLAEYKKGREATISSLRTNLSSSTEACRYCLSLKSMEGANWDQYRGESSWESCITSGKTERTCRPYKNRVDMCLYDDRPLMRMTISMNRKTMIRQMRKVANQAASKGCGNCGEFAVTAFMRLYDKSVRPIDWVSLQGADHSFVIIGRADGDINDYDTWGDAAAICDPWAQGFRSGDKHSGTYPGYRFEKVMGQLIGGFTGINLLHREA